VGADTVGTDAHHLGLQGMKLLEMLLETASLQGTAGGEITGVKVEHHPLTPKIFELAGVPLAIF
jgi:hypothetical protein